MTETLPLATFFFLKYCDNFKSAVSAGANSFRHDSEAEKKRLSGLRWTDQLVAARGGNTDGIAALVGTFVGCHLGDSSIQEEFKAVEDFSQLRNLGKDLVTGLPQP